MLIQCPFCGDNRKRFLRENRYEVDKAYFYEDENFSVSPDISPLVLGHMLIIPKAHYSCFGEITNEEMLSRIRDVSEWLLGNSDLLFFEHGAVLEGDGGASINHAHMHVMPRPKDLYASSIDQYILDSNRVFSNKLEAKHSVLHEFFLKRQPYVYYEIENERFAYPVNNPPSQFLRMMLQPYCNISYNWREVYTSKESKQNYIDTIDFINRIHSGLQSLPLDTSECDGTSY